MQSVDIHVCDYFIVSPYRSLVPVPKGKQKQINDSCGRTKRVYIICVN